MPTFDADQQTILESMGMNMPVTEVHAKNVVMQAPEAPAPEVADDEAELFDKYPGLFKPRILSDFVSPKWANFSLNYWIPSTSPAVLFTGGRGTGKGTVIEQIAAKYGYYLLKIEFTEDVTPDALVGMPRFKMKDGSGGDHFQSGPFLILSELESQGIKCILFCDEFNVTSPSAQMAFNSLTDKSGGFFCHYLSKRYNLRAPKIAFACNEGYFGTREIAKSTRDRLVPQFATYLPPGDESMLIHKRTGCAKALADKMVKCANVIRAAAAGQDDGTQIDFDMSPRPMLEVGELTKMGMSESEAWTICVIGRAGNSIRSEGTRAVLANLSKQNGFRVVDI